MGIVASSIVQMLDTLRAGDLSVAADVAPAPSREALTSVRPPPSPDLSLGEGDLALLAVVAAVLLALVTLAWLWVGRVNRRLQAALDEAGGQPQPLDVGSTVPRVDGCPMIQGSDESTCARG